MRGTFIESHYTHESSGEVSPDLAVPLGERGRPRSRHIISSRFLWYFDYFERIWKRPDALFIRGNFKKYKVAWSPKAWKLHSEKQVSGEKSTFQGVKVSSLKSPVCEAACGVVTTTRQLSGLTLIRLFKDRSPCKGLKPILGNMTSFRLW